MNLGIVKIKRLGGRMKMFSLGKDEYVPVYSTAWEVYFLNGAKFFYSYPTGWRLIYGPLDNSPVHVVGS